LFDIRSLAGLNIDLGNLRVSFTEIAVFRTGAGKEISGKKGCGTTVVTVVIVVFDSVGVFIVTVCVEITVM
jgi:predicted GNAT family acetyltransferase